jgi:hypothetical protein
MCREDMPVFHAYPVFERPDPNNPQVPVRYHEQISLKTLKELK